jgi:Amt family ammonium transporter
MLKLLRLWALPLLVALLWALDAGAQEAAPAAEPAAGAGDESKPLSGANANIMWTLIGGILVMFTRPGFSLVECGLERGKNAANIMMKNFADFMIGSLAFLLFGFRLMFGTSRGAFFGASMFCISGFEGLADAGGWKLPFWFFQIVFRAAAATIVSGAIAGRTRFSACLITSVLISAIICPISGHWAWNSPAGGFSGGAQGWLGARGFTDFAGSAAVHFAGGFVALAGAIIVGTRVGKCGPDGVARAILGHSLPLAGLRVFILWFGWFGFNRGSANAPARPLAASRPTPASPPARAFWGPCWPAGSFPAGPAPP